MHEYLLTETPLHGQLNCVCSTERKTLSGRTISVERMKETILRYYIFHCIRQNSALPHILGTVMIYVQDVTK